MVPVNSSIPLQIQTPQILTPNQLQQQKLTLQQLANTNMIQRQVQQENALKLQAQQEDQNDQETFQSALKNHTTIDPSGAPKTDWDSALAEASPNMRIRNVQAIQNDHMTVLKNAMEATTAQRAQFSASNQAVGQKLAQVYQTPVDQRLPVYQQARQDLIDGGYIKPDDPKYPAVPPDLSDKTLEAEIQGVGYMSNLLDQAKTKATTAEQEQKTKQANTAAQRGFAVQEYRALPVNPATGAPDPNSVATLQQKYPGVELPVDKAGRDAFISSSVPIENLPKYQIESGQAAALQNLKSDDWNKMIDSQVPATGKANDLNQRTKSAVQNAIALGMPATAVKSMIDKAAESVTEQERQMAVAKIGQGQRQEEIELRKKEMDPTGSVLGPKYKASDTRIIDGHPYKRGADGKWHLQSGGSQ